MPFLIYSLRSVTWTLSVKVLVGHIMEVGQVPLAKPVATPVLTHVDLPRKGKTNLLTDTTRYVVCRWSEVLSTIASWSIWPKIFEVFQKETLEE